MKTPSSIIHEQESPLTDKLAKAAEQVTAGARYMHYKQKSYKVIEIALREEDRAVCCL